MRLELERAGIPVFIQPSDLTELVHEYNIDICHVHRAGTYEPGTLPEKKARPSARGGDQCIPCASMIEKTTYRLPLFRLGVLEGDLRPPLWATAGSRYETLYNPVDFSEFDMSGKPFSSTIGRCSRADDQKWHDVCLDSLPKIFRKVPESRCLIQGATERVKVRLAALGLNGRYVELLEPST